MTFIQKLNESHIIVEQQEADDYFETNQPYHSLITYGTYEDLDQFSVDNQIPKDRLVYNYTDLLDLNQKYLSRLNAIYYEIDEIITFLFKHDLITNRDSSPTLADNIRMFIAKELPNVTVE